MLTSLDLMIIVVMVLAAASLLALALLFLSRNEKVRRICLYVTAALGVYMGYVGTQINWPGYTSYVIVAVVMALVAVGAVVVERLYKGQEKQFKLARAMAAVSLVVGMVNALFI